MPAQVLFLDVFSEKDPHLNALEVVSIYCYLIKYRAKQKHLLPFHITNKELKQIIH